MKFSESWLRELINPPITTRQLVDQLTMAGLEVETVTSCEPAFEKVIIARVRSISKHPHSGHLKICQVDAGDRGEYTVVCGADNVRKNGRYAMALGGESSLGEVPVQAAEIMGILSQGMLCSEFELGLSDDQSGLYTLGKDANPGQALSDYLSMPDNIIELSLTPNRGDCLSLSGIAREVAVLNNLRFRPPRPAKNAVKHQDKRDIGLSATDACPLYLGRIIHGIRPGAPLPGMIIERLRRSGIGSINAPVDLANYVMLELGQPMHVFDNDKLQGGIDVRYAAPDEQISLLDGKDYPLHEGSLVIADGSGPVALAGIMGGMHSAVGEDTRSVFIECAWFTPQAIMGKARQYGLHTEASHRYERGVDPALVHRAIEQLSKLIMRYCGGQGGPIVEAVADGQLPAIKSILLRPERVSRVLGMPVTGSQEKQLIRNLGFSIKGVGKFWNVTVPSYRFDVNIEADLIEEIARIRGYQHVTGEAPRLVMKIRPPAGTTAINSVKNVLVQRGYNEVINYSFVDPVLQALLLGESQEEITLKNPISSELSVMRRSLWPGLIQALSFNLNRQQRRLRLFEYGNIYPDKDGERPCIGGIIYGKSLPEQWGIKQSECDFYDMKSDVEAVLRDAGGDIRIEFRSHPHVALHPGQSAALFVNDSLIGRAGTLHPAIAAHLDIPDAAYLFELNLPALPAKSRIKYLKFSKYPAIKRDIAIIVDDSIPVDDIVMWVKSRASEYLDNLELFDLYQGEGIDLEKKSLALGLTFQRSSSTLTDREADAAVQAILQSLNEQFGAILRE